MLKNVFAALALIYLLKPHPILLTQQHRQIPPRLDRDRESTTGLIPVTAEKHVVKTGNS